MMTDPGSCLVVVTGPTCIGKTRISIALAKTLPAEIISCDSRQFYRELAVGVARPSDEELATVPHHMIGFLSVEEPYNVFRYECDALLVAETLFLRYKYVLLTGGSGLFIRAVTRGMDRLPDPDPVIRKDLLEQHRSEGLEPLQRKLQALDPEYFRIVDRQNPKRLLRALEVCLATGRPYSSFRTGCSRPRPFRVIKIGLTTDRQNLYSAINDRVDRMIASGLLDEVRSLRQYRHLNALNTVGYKELFDYLDGKIRFDSAVEKIKTHSLQYAKRQLTWLRKDREVSWFEPEQLDEMIAFVRLNS